MWRVIMFLKRLPSVAPKEALSGWLELHAPVLLEQITKVGSLSRASFNAATEGQLEGWSSDFDGVLELWFDEFLPAAAALSLLKNNLTIRADAGRWLDLDASPAWVGQAKTFLDKPGVSAKLLIAAQIADGWNEEEAKRYWSEVHPVVAQGDIQFWGRLLRYTQIHGFRTPGIGIHMPIAAEIGAASFEDIKLAFATEYYRTTVRPDEMRFVKPEGMLVLASCREQVIYERGADNTGSTSNISRA